MDIGTNVFIPTPPRKVSLNKGLPRSRVHTRGSAELVHPVCRASTADEYFSIPAIDRGKARLGENYSLLRPYAVTELVSQFVRSISSIFDRVRQRLPFAP